jgi:hypothetical protein
MPPTINWPSPLEKLRWTEAFRRRDKFVHGDDGRKFSCRYDKESVFVKPVLGYTPMGWLPYDLVFSEAWLHENSDPIYRSAVAEFLASEYAGVSVKAHWSRFEKTPLKTLERKFRDVGAPGVDILVTDNAVFLVKKEYKP